MLDISAYFDRIAYSGPMEPSAETLRALHRAHMLAVPFENLDIHIGCPIVCDEESFLRKIINQRRGGFCYELNGAFAALLRAVGFRVTLLSARVAGVDDSCGPEFDHLALRIDIPRETMRDTLRGVVPTASPSTWLADVGFGDSFIEPLLMQPNLAESQAGRVYRLVEMKSQSEVETEKMFYLEVKAECKSSQNPPEKENPADEKWKRQYSFTLRPRELFDFAPMCRYHQTSPESHFTRQRICTRATPEGRLTLSDWKLIETRNGNRSERELAGENQWRAVLRGLFQVSLPG